MKERLRLKTIPAILSFCAFALVLMQFLKIYHISTYQPSILAIAMIALIALIVPFKLLRLPLYTVTVILTLHRLFPLEDTSLSNWLISFYQTIVELFQAFINGRTALLPLQIAFLLVMIWIVLAIEIMIEYEYILLSYAIMIAYILVLAIYNAIDFDRQLIMIACLGLSHKFYLTRQERFFHKESRFYHSAVLITIILAAFLTLNLSWQALEFSLQRASIGFRDLLNSEGVYRFIKESGAPFKSKTGYSENDRVLGGPIVDDSGLVFEVITEKPHYWRINSKNIYTGSGWENNGAYGTISLSLLNEEELELSIPFGNNDKLIKEDKEPITINFYHHNIYVAVPYGKNTFKINEEALTLRYGFESDRLNFDKVRDVVQLELELQEFDYDLNELSQVSGAGEAVKNLYAFENNLELPVTLPFRVKELARNLTADKDGYLEKILVIEDYLKNSGVFTYSKMGAEFPQKGQDYVDHFLFESQIGYCDNFSTSMVVMLRSIGIPARWVKGFSEGQRVVEEGITKYLVRNRHAHSWVEVYFDGYGWIPFEPTPSFSGALEEEQSHQQESNPVNPDTPDNGASQEQNNSKDPDLNLGNKPINPDNSQENGSNFLDNLAAWQKNIISISLIVLIIAVLALLRKFITYLYVLLLLRYTDLALLHAYPLLLKKAEKYHKRPHNQSLLDYAQDFEAEYPQFSGSFIRLSSFYEAWIYGGITGDPDELRSLSLKVARSLSRMKKKRQKQMLKKNAENII